MSFFIFYSNFRSYGCYFLNGCNMLLVSLAVVAMVLSCIAIYGVYKIHKLLTAADEVVARIETRLDELQRLTNLQKETNGTFARIQCETSEALAVVQKRTQNLQRVRFEKQRKQQNGNGNKIRTR